jgi:hypothetical protein
MLETELKRLNENIEHLNKLLEHMAAMSKVNAETAKVLSEAPTQEVSSPEVEIEQGYTTDDIKSMALAISRADRSKQKDIKAKLAEHDAKVATDLTGDALQAVGEWLSALKSEIGA